LAHIWPCATLDFKGFFFGGDGKDRLFGSFIPFYGDRLILVAIESKRERNKNSSELLYWPKEKKVSLEF